MSDRAAQDVYWSQLVEVDNGRWFFAVILTVVFVLFPGLPEDWPTDPRYRVLVGRHDSDALVGVRQARTRRAARRCHREVEALLASSTAAEASRTLELDF